MLVSGIDAGSRMIKAVVLDTGTRRIVASGQSDQGIRQAQLARELFEDTLRQAGIPEADVARTVATGYGRNTIAWAQAAITEITCHAIGVRHLSPAARTVIDIGGQDSKLIRLGPDGRVLDFMMNDRCAAGTGRFLEIVAQRLELPLDELGTVAGRAKKPAIISSMCAVFAETEIVGLLASGQHPEDIAAGVQSALTSRVAAMAGSRLEVPVVFTGGVARVAGMAPALSRALGHPVQTAPDPCLTGALGAALYAIEL